MTVAVALPAEVLARAKPEVTRVLHPVDPVVVFRARCRAQATLVAASEMDLHDSVDGLQAAAVRTGLVALLGQDAVQAIMADAFTIVKRDETPAKHARGAARSTIEAAMFSLRERGTAALGEPDTQRRISQLNETQLHEVGARLQRFAPKIARPWIAEEIGRLIETWEACHHA